MKSLCFLLTLLAFGAPIRAQMTQLSATFSGHPVFIGQTFDFSGSFSFNYDASLIPATGSHTFANVAPTTLSLSSPQVGGTTFTEANTFVHLFFLEGEFSFIALGDRTGATVFDIVTGTDDLFVLVRASGLNNFVFFTNENPSLFAADFAPTVSYSITAIPEPSTHALVFGFGCLVFATARRATRNPLVPAK